jgi:hypothetical protein
LTGWWTIKESSEKMEGRGGGDAQGVADPPPPPKKYPDIHKIRSNHMLYEPDTVFGWKSGTKMENPFFCDLF